MVLIIRIISNKIMEILEKRGNNVYIFKQTSSNYSDTMLVNLFSDTRIDHLPFTSPLSAMLVITFYLYFVKKLGPAYMSKRKPFGLQKLICIYDLIQIILNFALFVFVNDFVSFLKLIIVN